MFALALCIVFCNRVEYGMSRAQQLSYILAEELELIADDA